MKSFFLRVFVLSFVVCFVGCNTNVSDKEKNTFDYGLLIIQHDKDGKLIDYTVYNR